jgi:hypothetical protein
LIVQLLDARSSGEEPKERRSTGGRRRGWASAVALVAMAVATATACPSRQDADSTPTQPATTPPAGTSVPPAPDLLDDPTAIVDFERPVPWAPRSRELILAYAAAQQAWVKARVGPPNPDLPALADTHTGEIMELRKKLVRDKYANADRALRPPTTLVVHPKGARFDGDDASLDACITLAIEQIRPSSGEVTDTDHFSQDISAQLTKRGEVWMLSGETPNGAIRDGDSCPE